jgi:hypothetical protein
MHFQVGHQMIKEKVQAFLSHLNITNRVIVFTAELYLALKMIKNEKNAVLTIRKRGNSLWPNAILFTK